MVGAANPRLYPSFSLPTLALHPFAAVLTLGTPPLSHPLLPSPCDLLEARHSGY